MHSVRGKTIDTPTGSFSFGWRRNVAVEVGTLIYCFYGNLCTCCLIDIPGCGPYDMGSMSQSLH